MKQEVLELKDKIDKSIITLEDFSTFLSMIDMLSRQKISKNIEVLNNTINQLDNL